MGYKANINHSIEKYDVLIEKAQKDCEKGKFKSRESYLAYLATLESGRNRYVELLKDYENELRRTGRQSR